LQAQRPERCVEANWKLVWDNNRECLHCKSNHPQYVAANFDMYDGRDDDPEVVTLLATRVAASEHTWGQLGLAATHKTPDLAEFPSPDGRTWWSANRTVLVEGWLTESMDGRRVAPLMGEYSDPDVGVLRMRTMPNMWMHGSCDHAVLTRLVPDGPSRTMVRTLWLVAGDAIEGADYDTDRLQPFWGLTNEQDWTICERQQKGVRSPAYEPGPLSKSREYNVANFHAWYLRAIALDDGPATNGV
jgi:glycine betaine catabolism A